MKKNKGFTLLELLVVIAIIGILSTIVMVSLSDTRQRAQDARLESYLNQARTRSQIYYLDDFTYTNFCTEDEFLVSLIEEILEDSIDDDLEDINCSADGEKFCLSFKSASDSDKVYCVDHTGVIGALGNCTAGGTCPTN